MSLARIKKFFSRNQVAPKQPESTPLLKFPEIIQAEKKPSKSFHDEKGRRIAVTGETKKKIKQLHGMLPSFFHEDMPSSPPRQKMDREYEPPKPGGHSGWAGE